MLGLVGGGGDIDLCMILKLYRPINHRKVLKTEKLGCTILIVQRQILPKKTRLSNVHNLTKNTAAIFFVECSTVLHQNKFSYPAPKK